MVFRELMLLYYMNHILLLLYIIFLLRMNSTKYYRNLTIKYCYYTSDKYLFKRSVYCENTH